mgnify:FL=1
MSSSSRWAKIEALSSSIILVRIKSVHHHPTFYLCRMAGNKKDEKAILDKFGIKALNPMQEAAHKAIRKESEVVLLSPTGTGKTLAFLLPLLDELDPKLKAVQALILLPSRELAIQVEQVFREMGSGYKANAVYGGRSGYKDRMEIQHPPTVLIGTPGRVADHMRNGNLDMTLVKTLILDEFDKSLEVGFEDEMKEIIVGLPALKKKILTSATEKVKIPPFVGIKKATRLDFLKNNNVQLQIISVVSPDRNKFNTLVQLLKYNTHGNGIIFCNLKDSIQKVSDALTRDKIDHACFYGGLEQLDRERALIKFRNGTHRLLVATDLAARGIDVPAMDFIVHYELPPTEDEFVHRNGRTARMKTEGTAYVLRWKQETLPEFIKGAEEISPRSTKEEKVRKWKTLYITGGRKDKISKSDIAGLFFKQGKLTQEELGVIELKQDCSYVSVVSTKYKELIETLNNSRLKKKKVRISLLE